MKTRFIRQKKNTGEAMKKYSLASAIIAATLCLILCGCIPLTRSIQKRAAFQAMNEKIFIYPLIDSSSLDSLQEWPDEKNFQEQLKNVLKKFDAGMAVEFRRNEKYGLYEMVDDSSASDIRITFIMEKCQLKKDTLLLPIQMKVNQSAFGKNYILQINAFGIYRAKSAPESQIHYLYIILSDFCRNFPYNKAAGVFFRPE